MEKIDGSIQIHPGDREKVKAVIDEAIKNPGTIHSYLFRYLHKDGHYLWLDGTVTKLLPNEFVNGLVFNARDVSERIELEQLLVRANTLARIGSWDVDLLKGTVYWDHITREIQEAESSFVPNLATGLHFYKEGPVRELIKQKIKEAIELSKPWDEELEIITSKNNVRWIRTIGETEIIDSSPFERNNQKDAHQILDELSQQLTVIKMDLAYMVKKFRGNYLLNNYRTNVLQKVNLTGWQK